jgi:hypothetical protein
VCVCVCERVSMWVCVDLDEYIIKENDDLKFFLILLLMSHVCDHFSPSKCSLLYKIQSRNLPALEIRRRLCQST